MCIRDSVKAWHMDASGTYTKPKRKGEKPFSVQELLMAEPTTKVLRGAG